MPQGEASRWPPAEAEAKNHPPNPMTQTQKALDGRTLGALLVLNLLVHFVPFARPGFQPDDFVWLHLARQGEPWSFIGTALSQATRPLGSLLFMLLPYALGLHESTQLLVLIGTTSLLTALCHLYFSGMFPRPMAALATFIFVVWPVKQLRRVDLVFDWQIGRAHV